ncbi:hypothetical protein ACW2Q0_05095 [Nocardia sp. R16R-3T]
MTIHTPDTTAVVLRGGFVAAHRIDEVDGDRLVALITGAAPGSLEVTMAGAES